MGVKVTRNWLNNYVATTKTNAELAEIMTTAGLEVDDSYALDPGFSKVIVGKITQTEKHPNADKLSVCTVDVGADSCLTIVCGCSSVKPGLVVAAAIIGAKLPGGLAIKKTKLRGVESQGMLCSASELNLPSDRDGIMHLADDLAPGDALADVLNLNDHIFEIEITPDRGDCLSAYGVARDISAISESKLNSCNTEVVSLPESPLKVQVDASSDCLCYYGRYIKNIDINSTKSFYGDDYLTKISFGKVDRVVDIANFAMLDKGQPFHVFDADKISGNITVRYSKAGEVASLLNDETITLKDNTLVIADDEKILAIAGVMGCSQAKVSSTTTNIFIEAAHFVPESIARSCRDYRLASDSAYRFERGVDAQKTEQRLAELCNHILSVVGGDVIGSVAVKAEASLELAPIELRPAQLKKLLGIDINDNTITTLLESIGSKVTLSSGIFYVVPPSWRFDLRLEVDLIEELMRQYGYDNIPKSSLNFTMQPCSIKNVTKDLSGEIAAYLKSIGLIEALCYSMISEEESSSFGKQELLKLKNPISNNMTVMRKSLLPGLVKAMSFNKCRQKDNIKFFEIGQCFDSAGSYETNVAGILAGNIMPENWVNAGQKLDFYDVKAICEQICTLTDLNVKYEKSVITGMHHGKSARIVTKDNAKVGVVGVIDPLLAKKHDLCKNTVLFEITMPASIEGVKQYREHSKYPGIKRDLSLLIEDDTSFEEICDIINSLNIKVLQNIKLNDIYYPDKERKSIKSLCISLLFQHTKRTLLEEDVVKYITKIVQTLSENNINIRL